jgi:hypothetical protein
MRNIKGASKFWPVLFNFCGRELMGRSHSDMSILIFHSWKFKLMGHTHTRRWLKIWSSNIQNWKESRIESRTSGVMDNGVFVWSHKWNEDEGSPPSVWRCKQNQISNAPSSFIMARHANTTKTVWPISHCALHCSPYLFNNCQKKISLQGS